MKKIWITFALGFIGCAAVVFADGSINMQEGSWEVTSTVNMPGMSLPPSSYTQCITEQDLIPQNNQPGQECTMSNVKQKGDRVMWEMRCNTAGGNMVGKGAITYKGTTFAGDMEMTISGQQGMQMSTHMEGRRIGDCP